MGLFGVKTIWWAAGGQLCPCCMKIRDEFVHFGLGGAAFDPGPGLCTYCWRNGHQRRSRPCVDPREFVCGRHPNETVNLNGRKWLWAQVLEVALEDAIDPADLPQEWLDCRRTRGCA